MMNSEKKTIVYIGSFDFPMGDAVAKRALGIGMALSKAGYSVAFIGESKNVARGKISEEKVYGQFKYCSIHKAQSAKEHYQYRNDLKIVRNKLEEWNSKNQIAAVVFCGTKCALFAGGLVRICKKMHISTIADSMDWLKTHTGNIIFDAIKQADITYELCVVNRKANGVIAISEFLSDYYKKKGMKTLIVPPISPYSKSEDVVECNGKLTLVYAGIPCRLGKPLRNVEDAKDRLDLAIQLLYGAYQKECQFQFFIYGLTKEEYCVIFPEQNSMVEELLLAGRIRFMGYAQESIVRQAVERADYTVLLRNKNRTSMAGFPTKIAESITLGTPVITTDTSDIGRYVKEGDDGYFLDILDIKNAERKIIQIFEQGKKQSLKMKEMAVQNSSFVAKTYAAKLGSFIDSLI